MKIISRREWGAEGPNGADVSSKLPWGEVVLHTEAGAQRSPADEATEKGWIRNIEAFHIGPQRGWNGIAYSFLIAPSGRIFEGRGWGRSGAHTEGRNSTALGLCFLGHGDKWPATEQQWAAARWLIAEGIATGKLRANPKISGHRNYSQKGKTCPGDLIYPHLDRLRGITGHAPTGGGLRPGDKGPGVGMLQGMLNILAAGGARPGPTGKPGRQIEVTEEYTPETRAAVGEFQAFARVMQELAGNKVTIEVTGTADEGTLGAIAFWVPFALEQAR